MSATPKRRVFILTRAVVLGVYDEQVQAESVTDAPLAIDRVVINAPWTQFLFINLLRIGSTTIQLGGVDASLLTTIVDDLLRGESLPVRKGDSCAVHMRYSGWCPHMQIYGCPFNVTLSLLGPTVDTSAL